MKYLAFVLAACAASALGACTTVNTSAPANRLASPSSPTESAHPAPTVTKTVTPRPRSPAAATPQQTQAPQPDQASQPTESAPSTVPNVTSPWAVVSGYYGDIESGNYREAWALLSFGMVTGQSYEQFVSGFSCTGDQQ